MSPAHFSSQQGGEFYRALFESSHTVMLIIDPSDGTIVDANAQAAKYYGWPIEVLVTMRIADINTLPFDEIKVEMAQAESEQCDHFNFKHRLANGKLRDVEVYSGPIKLAGRSLLYSIIHDVTRKVTLELGLAFFARRAMYLLELPRIADTLGEKDFMQRGLDMAEELTGSTISFIHLVNEDEQSIELVTWSRRTLDGYCHAAFDRHYPVNEAGIWADAMRQRRPVMFNDYATASNRRGLPEGHATLHRLISLPVVEQGRVMMLVGIGNKPTDYTEQDIETLQLMANDVWRLVERGRAQRQMADSMQRLRELNQKLEAAHSQLLQSEKMASVGQLAAGVAHELNNPIGFVSSNLGSLESYLQDIFSIMDAYAAAEVHLSVQCTEFDQARKLRAEKDYDFLRTDIIQLLHESRDGLARVAKIVKDLKDFSRAGEAAMQWADLQQGLDSTLNVVWNELKYKCTVVKDYGVIPDVWCEPSQLNQVFMNLLMNAGHAIPETGEITLRTGQRGDEVFVSVGDTGAGIPPENLNRIFEPFFTTKPIGKGTGLGLSLAYGIVQKHHGRIEVESAVGKGTTFTVWLPVAPVG